MMDNITMLMYVVMMLSIALVHVDAIRRADFTLVLEGTGVPKKDNHSLEVIMTNYFCNSCIEASAKVEEILIDESFNEEIDALSNEICHNRVPSIEMKMCTQMARKYVRQASLCVQAFLFGENVCRNIKLKNSSISRIPLSTSGENEMLFTMESSYEILSKVLKGLLTISLKHKEYKSCAPCRNAMENLHNVVGNTERQIMIIKILHEACEVADPYVHQCKKMVLVYGPLLLGNVQKILMDNDLCYTMNMCKDPLPPPCPPSPPVEKYQFMAKV
uniref:Proactivator polypeptide-like 1 n=1 Tax=Anthurium amnicola TaxID=1678845 RepID=A0A1D1XS21_9ARAE